MSEEGNSGKKWIWCLVILVGLFIALLVFYKLYLRHLKSINNWQEVILSFSPIIILFLIGYGIVLAGSLRFSNNKMIQCGALLIVEIISIVVVSISIIYNNHLILTLMAIIILIVILVTVFLASTKFFYTEYECWRKRVRANIEEWFLNDNFFWKALLWSATFLILFTFVLVTVIILYHKYNSGYEFLVNLITNKDLFEWTFNLFLFTFFALIISVIGQFLSKDKSKVTENKNISKEVHKDKVDENPKTDGGKDSEFLFYMLSVKVLIIWALVLIVVYSLTRTHINNNSNNNILAVSIYYTLFITIFYYFLKKFFEVINFTMSGQRLKIKSTILLCSRLNEHTLRLWNVFWGNEQFGDALKEGVFLSDFVSEIVYHKKYFQLKDQVSVAADALRGFSDNIDKRYSEALAREVLNIVPRNRRIPPKRLPEYLVDALNAYKDIVCNDRLVCEEPDFRIFFYKWFFKSEVNEFLSKYQYLDELIYQILVTLRKSIEKLRNDGYFKEHDESRRILCEKFNKFVDTLGNLECVSNKGKKGLQDALKTESAKKWIKEAGNLLRTINKANYYNCSSLLSDFTKALQTLKKFENLP